MEHTWALQNVFVRLDWGGVFRDAAKFSGEEDKVPQSLAGDLRRSDEGEEEEEETFFTLSSSSSLWAPLPVWLRALLEQVVGVLMVLKSA